MKLSKFRKSQEKGFQDAILVHQNTNTEAVYVLTRSTVPELLIEVKRYIFDGERWTVGYLYAGKDIIEAMKKFQGCLNNAIVDPLEGLKFTCPGCGKHRVECCQDGYHKSRVTRIDEHGDHDYGDLSSHGEVLRWQCESCGYVLEFSGDITDNVEMAQWVLENCQSPEVQKK